MQFADIEVPGGVEDGRRHDEDRRIDEEGGAQGDDGVDRVVVDGPALTRGGFLDVAGLDERGVQVEIVWHHGSPEDAERDVERLGVGNRRHDESGRERSPLRARQDNLDRKARRDGGHEGDDDRLDLAEAEMHRGEQQHDVESGDHDTPDERNSEQQVKGDRRADHLGQVASDDCDLAQEPKDVRDRLRITIAAGLGEIAPARNPKPHAKRLQEHRHQVRKQNHPQEGVAELGAAGEVGRPVAGIHVTDGDQITWTGESEEPLQPPPDPGDADAAVDLGQGETGRGVRLHVAIIEQFSDLCCAISESQGQVTPARVAPALFFPSDPAPTGQEFCARLR